MKQIQRASLFTLAIVLSIVLISCQTTKQSTVVETNDGSKTLHSSTGVDLTPADADQKKASTQQLKRLETCLKHRCNTAESWLNYARHLMLVGQPREAQAASERALLLDPKLSPARIVVAESYVAQNHFELAETVLKSVTKDEFKGQVAMLRGMIFVRQGLQNDAAHQFRLSLAQNQDNVSARMNLALIYLSNNQHRQAAIELEKILVIKPDFYPALTHLAVCRSFMGDFLKAEHIYQSIESNMKEDAIANYNRALNLARMGLWEASYKYAEYAMDTRRASPEIQDLATRLKDAAEAQINQNNPENQYAH